MHSCYNTLVLCTLYPCMYMYMYMCMTTCSFVSFIITGYKMMFRVAEYERGQSVRVLNASTKVTSYRTRLHIKQGFIFCDTFTYTQINCATFVCVWTIIKCDVVCAPCDTSSTLFKIFY